MKVPQKLEFSIEYRAMNRKSNQSNSRLIIAIALFAAALISAVALSALSNQRESYWVTAATIAPGMRISQSDITTTKVALGSRSNIYLTSRSSPVGAIATRRITEGELLPLSAIEDSPSRTNIEQVPLVLQGGDIPLDIAVGEEVNIYWVPEALGLEPPAPPMLVLGNIYLQSIDRKSSNFGNDLGVTALVPSRDVIALLKATTSGRIVIVRAHG